MEVNRLPEHVTYNQISADGFFLLLRKGKKKKTQNKKSTKFPPKIKKLYSRFILHFIEEIVYFLEVKKFQAHEKYFQKLQNCDVLKSPVVVIQVIYIWVARRKEF